MARQLHYVQEFSASPRLINSAFTNAIMLRNWMCDYAFINRFQGNNYLFTWNDGYSASGRYKTLEPNKVIFSWFGQDDPGATTVDASITAQGTGSRVEVTHSGFGEGEAWEKCAADIDAGWRSGLENLAYYLKTGLDERIVRRPMLGINIGVLTEELKTALQLPFREGLYLDGVADNMGAKAAGLSGNDLIVRFAGHSVRDYGTLVAALKGKKGGDTVEVEFYRGANKHALQMRLSERPLPKIADSAEEIAADLRVLFAELAKELDALLDGVSSEESASRPAPDTWSINENLAHLIFTERFSQLGIWGIVAGDDTFIWTENNPAQISPILSVYKSKDELAAEFKRTLEGLAAQVAALPADAAADRSKLAAISQQFLGTADHTRGHYRQIQEALALVRSQREVAPI